MFRSSCGIDLGDFFIVTGGGINLKNKVSKYSKTGLVADLAQLNEGRALHACSLFKADGGDQVLLVTGGYNTKALSSTEISTDLGASWKISASLPSAMFWLRAVTYGNSVLLLGNLRLSSPPLSRSL